MTSTARRRVLDEAKRERRELNAWVRGGREGDRPPTPTLDALAREHELQRRH